MKLCTEHGYKTQRITVADDMATLAEAGLDAEGRGEAPAKAGQGFAQSSEESARVIF